MTTWPPRRIRCSRGSVPMRPGGEPGALQVLAGRGQLGAHLRREPAAQRVEVGAGGHLGAGLVDHPEGDGEVLGQPVQLPGVARDVHAAHPAQLALQPVEQRFVARRSLAAAASTAPARGRVPGRSAGAACLGRVLISAVTSSSRSPGTCQVNGVGSTWCSAATGTSTVTPSVRAPGLERVRQRQREPAGLDVVGVGGAVDGGGLRGAEHLLGEVEQLRLPARGPSSTSSRSAARTPRRPGSARRRSATSVSSSTTRSRRRARCSSSSTSVEQLAVGVEEPVAGVPVALDQRVPDEQLARQLGVDPAEVDLAADDDRDAVAG